MHIRRLRNKLVIAALLVLLPFLVITTLSQLHQFSEDQTHAISDHAIIAKDLADKCDNYVMEIVTLERAVGVGLWDERIRRNDYSSLLSDIKHRVSPRIKHISAVDTRGNIIASDMPGMIGLNGSRFKSMQKVMGGQEWAVSDLFSSRRAKGRFFSVATGIRDPGGKLKGALIALADNDSIEKTISMDRLDSNLVVITDSKGQVVMAYGNEIIKPAPQWWVDTYVVREALKGKSCTFDSLRMPDGRTAVGAVEPVSRIGWTVAVLTPRERIMAPINRQLIALISIGVLLVGLTIGFAIRIGDRVARPAVELAHTARELGRGDLDVRANIYSGDELQFLGENLNRMAGALQDRDIRLTRAVESEHLQAQRGSALYSVAQSLIVTMDIDERLEVIAQALTSICNVKRCMIFLQKKDRLVASVSWGMPCAESFRSLIVQMPDLEARVGESLKSGAPVLIPESDRDAILGSDAAAQLSMGAHLVLPLIRRQHIVGLAILDSPDGSVECTDESLEAARGFATLAAIAIENAESFAKWWNISQAFQKALLPVLPCDVGSFSCASRYYAALEASELGGDFYDFIPLSDGRVGLVIADVSGKGLEAAVFTAMGKYTLRAYASENPDPGTVLTRVNDSLSGMGGDWGFVTLFYGVLDPSTGHLVYANAGHPPSLLARSSGEVTELKCPDSQPPLGVFPGIRYLEAEIDIHEGDVLTGYTDGVIEARHDGERFEIERLTDIVRESRNLSPVEIAETIHRAVTDFSLGRQQDDIALLIIKHQNV